MYKGNHWSKLYFRLEKNLVRSGIRTHASNWRPEHSYAVTAQAMLESGALDRSAILTVDEVTDYKVHKTSKNFLLFFRIH